jgi:hypothetical protein
VLKYFAANCKRRLSALPNVDPYMYDVKISGFTRTLVGLGLRGVFHGVGIKYFEEM